MKPPRDVTRGQIIDALDEHGPQTAPQLSVKLGCGPTRGQSIAARLTAMRRDGYPISIAHNGKLLVYRLRTWGNWR